MTDTFDPSQVMLLFADDDAEFRASVARRFVRRGFRVREAADGFEAIQSANQAACDVAVIDLVMPGMSGLEVLKALKAKYPLLQIMIMTGQGSADSRATAKQLGAVDFVTKPVRLDQLEALVERAYLVSREQSPAAAHAQ